MKSGRAADDCGPLQICGNEALRIYGAGQRCSIIARSSSAISFPSPTHASFMRMWVVAGMSKVRRFIETFGTGPGLGNSSATAAGGVGTATAAGGIGSAGLLPWTKASRSSGAGRRGLPKGTVLPAIELLHDFLDEAPHLLRPRAFGLHFQNRAPACRTFSETDALRYERLKNIDREIRQRGRYITADCRAYDLAVHRKC